jgi:nucleoid-associated protein YgaU
MRKEVQAGAVIGAVLIVVMVVFSLVGSKGHDKKKDQVVFDPGKTGGDSSGGAGPTDPAGPSHDDPIIVVTHDPVLAAATPSAHDDAAPAPAPAPAAPEGRSTTNWGALLSADRVEDVMPVKTRTPEPARSPAPSDAPAPRHPVNVDAPTQLPPSDAPPATTDSPSPDSHAKPTAPTTGGTTYHIASGDTFSSIAHTAYGNAKYYKEIIKANPRVDPSHLKPGMVITLPDKAQVVHNSAPAASTGGDSTESRHHSTPTTMVAAVDATTEYRVQSNDNLYKISMKLYHSPNKVDAIYQLNKSTIGADPAKLKLNMVLKLPEPPTQTASRS